MYCDNTLRRHQLILICTLVSNNGQVIYQLYVLPAPQGCLLVFIRSLHFNSTFSLCYHTNTIQKEFLLVFWKEQSSYNYSWCNTFWTSYLEDIKLFTYIIWYSNSILDSIYFPVIAGNHINFSCGCNSLALNFISHGLNCGTVWSNECHSVVSLQWSSQFIVVPVVQNGFLWTVDFSVINEKAIV